MANQDGQFGPQTSFSGIAEVGVRYFLSDQSTVSAGAAGFYRNEFDPEVARRDLYLEYQNRWVRARAGSRKDSIRAQQLSITNKDYLFSGNSRPLSGLLVEAFEPIRISNTFSLDWGIAHYTLNDDRYVDGTWVHYKCLALRMRFNERNLLIAKLTHYAQWGGTSPKFGDLPDDFAAFIDVFFARRASEDSGIDRENANAVGNHLGSYYLDYYLNTDRGTFNIYHEHPFEDGSGTRLANFPDGIWGLHWRWTDNPWLDGVLYEYIQTTDQSGNPGGSGGDNYFSNGIYKSGWSYDGQIIGLPLILIDNSLDLDDNATAIVSNRIKAHHLGLLGHIDRLQWMVKSTFARQFGRYQIPFDPAIDIWSAYLGLRFRSDIGVFGLEGAFDLIDPGLDRSGFGISYRYYID
ncbi:hypothetical protein BST85_04395 [Aureitalea marina]|uniref:Alginate export domain-containing protein n=1 Tax=Aureitalea marina TaxID=930804 RepID=A0A2S7KNN4_9FLAO|nr:hypothetical protein BST85_04395 [Aureitalea marina]